MDRHSKEEADGLPVVSVVVVELVAGPPGEPDEPDHASDVTAELGCRMLELPARRQAGAKPPNEERGEPRECSRPRAFFDTSLTNQLFWTVFSMTPTQA